MSVVKIKIACIVSIKKNPHGIQFVCTAYCVIYRTDDMFSKTSNVHIHVKWTAAYITISMSYVGDRIHVFIYNWDLLNVDRYLYTFCSFKMSEEIILEWAIFLGFYIFLLVLFFLNIYFISSFLILYIVLQFIQSKNKKLLTACKKQGGPCDRVR